MLKMLQNCWGEFCLILVIFDVDGFLMDHRICFSLPFTCCHKGCACNVGYPKPIPMRGEWCAPCVVIALKLKLVRSPRRKDQPPKRRRRARGWRASLPMLLGRVKPRCNSVSSSISQHKSRALSSSCRIMVVFPNENHLRAHVAKFTFASLFRRPVVNSNVGCASTSFET